jgi:hypothetical protein
MCVTGPVTRRLAIDVSAFAVSAVDIGTIDTSDIGIDARVRVRRRRSRRRDGGRSSKWCVAERMRRSLGDAQTGRPFVERGIGDAGGHQARTHDRFDAVHAYELVRLLHCGVESTLPPRARRRVVEEACQRIISERGW